MLKLMIIFLIDEHFQTFQNLQMFAFHLFLFFTQIIDNFLQILKVFLTITDGSKIECDISDGITDILLKTDFASIFLSWFILNGLQMIEGIDKQMFPEINFVSEHNLNLLSLLLIINVSHSQLYSPKCWFKLFINSLKFYLWGFDKYMIITDIDNNKISMKKVKSSGKVGKSSFFDRIKV